MMTLNNLYNKTFGKLSKNARIIIIIAIAAVVALIIIFFIGKNYYSDKFFPGTAINGWDCSGETVDEVKEDLQALVEEYSLTIKERDGQTEEITGKELGLLYTDNGEVDDLMKDQKNELWFMHLGGQEFDVKTAYTYSDDTLNKIIDGLDCFDEAKITDPKNAELVLQDDQFIISPEVEGNRLNKENTVKAISDAVNGAKKEIDLEELDLYERPAVLSTDEALADQMNQSNVMLGASITYDFVDRQMTADSDEIISWIIKGDDGIYTLDRDKVYEWVQNMAYETDTFGLTHQFMTSYGVEITLQGGGDYGWCIDKDETTDNLCNYIKTGQVATIQPDYLYTGLDRSKNDIGDTYVEVCITTQTLWCYKDGQLLTTTPIISGNEATGYCTPSGSVWAIDAKKTDWKFTHFANAYSDYWMPFNDECGIHDASWQPPESYNTETYKTAGSHGCLNTPYDSMKIIYENMEIGYPVVVYYSLDQIVGPEPTQDLIAG